MGDSAMSRKIVHLDMDCFYAAIEVRDHPHYKGKPVGVGGESGRGVLTTANYEARKFGCRSAMPVFKAKQLCPHLILTPIRFEVYRKESLRIREIFARYTDLIEPISLDEAYLDLSHRRESGAAVAREIRKAIFDETGLTASAGIAPNKMLAKIASDWNKPDGQLEIGLQDVEAFMRGLRIGKIPGVGQRGLSTLAKMGVQTCGDLQKYAKAELVGHLGRWGLELYDRCRGRDDREVLVDRIRKSLSKEKTFRENIHDVEWLIQILRGLMEEVQKSVATHKDQRIKSRFIKLKFEDFSQTTAEKSGSQIDEMVFVDLLRIAWNRGQGKSVRLLGAGIKFASEQDQLEFL